MMNHTVCNIQNSREQGRGSGVKRPTLTGRTKNLAVIGLPIEHSLSPVLQNAALWNLGLDYTYIALPVEEKKLKAAVEGLRATNFCGFNVTIPHKRAIIPLLDEVTEDAKAIGAVNTVVNDNGRLVGHNTDWIGFVAGLRSKGFSPMGKNVVILGNGGAARGILHGLIKEGAKRIVLAGRNLAKCQSLIKDFQSSKGEIIALDWSVEAFKRHLAETDLLVNATPLGMAPKVEAMPPVDLSLLKPGAFVSDAIYTPAKTEFLRVAEKWGHPYNNGEDMLIYQGAAAFKLWTGKEPNTDVMKRALKAALGE